MTWLQRMSIRGKLALALVGAVLLASALAGVALVLYQSFTQKDRALKIMQPYAQLVSVGAETAVDFQDPGRAEDILTTLRANPQILEAVIELRDGRVLAHYHRGPNASFHPHPPKPDGVYLAQNSAELLQSLQDGAQLHLVMSLDELNRSTRSVLLQFAAWVLLLVAAVTLGLRMMLQRTIVRPISTLAETVEQVRSRADYHQRVPAVGTDEVARLGQSFNAMMGAIQEREKELHGLSLFQRTILDNVAYGIISTAPDGMVTSFNHAAERMLGYRADEVIGKQAATRWHDPEEVARYALHLSEELGETISPGFDVFAARARRDLPEENEWTFIRKDGGRLPVLLSVTALRAESGQILGFVGLTYDLTERKRLKIAQGESEQKFRSLAENSSENIFRYDKQCRVIYANHQVKVTLLGEDSSFLGLTPIEISPNGLYGGEVAELENYQATLKQVISSGEMADVELYVRDSNGAQRTHSIRITVERDQEDQIVGALAFGRDITEKAKLEDQLRQAQKMEAIGQLAGGVAHDFNNILTAIIGFGNLAKMKMTPDDPQQILIDHILASADRAAHLTQSLLAFSRKQVIIPRPVDLNIVVKSVEKLLGRLIGEDIEFITRLAGPSLVVMADAGQIEQVLMNLATNARDAMPRGGELSISTEMKMLGKDFTDAHGYGEAGNYAVITVSDTGIGMDEATRGKIFEPFFTTKEQGKGTGLGLSMVYGIVKQHEGNISVYSEPGKGTTFRILLPLIALEAEEARRKPDGLPPGGKETLLLAEDDHDVHALTAAVLRDFGYRVIDAVDGKEAIEKYRLLSKEIDLLILDVIMPKMSGKEVFDAVKAINPGSKILFISGYTADALHKKGIFKEGVQFIAKPMSPFELLKKVREILDAKP